MPKLQQYGYFIFFLFFLRDILLRIGKTATISPQQITFILLVDSRGKEMKELREGLSDSTQKTSAR